MRACSLVRFSLVLLFLLAILSTAFAADALYECGNHNPRHGANNTEEVKSLSTQYGCGKWHIGPATTAMADPLKKKYLDQLNAALAFTGCESPNPLHEKAKEPVAEAPN